MQRLISALLLLLLPALAEAQGWQLQTHDDGSYFTGAILAPEGSQMTLLCGERSPRGMSPHTTGNTEPDITPTGAFRLYLSEADIGAPDPERTPRSDVMIVAGSTGYKLRSVKWDELFAVWYVDLVVDDALFSAMSAVPVVELRLPLRSAKALLRCVGMHRRGVPQRTLRTTARADRIPCDGPQPAAPDQRQHGHLLGRTGHGLSGARARSLREHPLLERLRPAETALGRRRHSASSASLRRRSAAQSCRVCSIWSLSVPPAPRATLAPTTSPRWPGRLTGTAKPTIPASNSPSVMA